MAAAGQDGAEAHWGGAPLEQTHWSRVLAAGRPGSPEAQQALESLCQCYWPALYAYVRRRVPSVHDAQDLTQAFFAQFLAGNYVGMADPNRGKFRAFLLTAFRHFLSKEWEKMRAQKRGGGQTPIPLDSVNEEGAGKALVSGELTPDQIYDREWALTLLNRVMQRLHQECVKEGKSAHFEELKGFIVGGLAEETYAEVADKLGTTEAAAKMAAHRMRRRYRDLLRSEVAQTVGSPMDIEEELRNLLAILSG